VVYSTAVEVWTDINNATTVEHILTILSDAETQQNPIKLDASDLKNLATSQSVNTGGKNVLLYSGDIGTSSAKNIALSIVTSDSTVQVIDNVDAGILADSEEFKASVLRSLDFNAQENTKFFFGTSEADGTRITNGLWDDLSDSFVSDNASGDVRVISPFSVNSSVFSQTELPKLLADSGVTHINGVAKADISSANGGALNAVKQWSATDLIEMDATQTGVGKTGSQLLGESSGWADLKASIDADGILTKSAMDIAGKAAKTIFVVSMISLFADIEEGYANNGTQGAADVVGQFIVDETNGNIAFAIAAGAILAVLAVVPFSVPVLVGAAIVFIGGTAGELLLTDYIASIDIGKHLGIAEDDPRVVNYVLDGQSQTLAVDDIYVDGYHVYGNDFWTDPIDFTPNLVQGVDTITGTSQDDLVLGGLNAEHLDGGSNDDTIIGDAGNDTIIASEGDDVIDGGADIDTLDFRPLDAGLDNAVNVDLAAGTAHINYLLALDDDYLVYNVENVIGGGNDDTISGSFAANVLAGGLGEDVLSGAVGDDFFVMQYEEGSIIDTVVDEITDFKVGGEADKIVLDGFGGVVKMSDLAANAEQDGADVVLHFDNYYDILVRNITIAALLDPDNFADPSNFSGFNGSMMPDGGSGSLLVDDINGNVVDGTAVGNSITTAYIDGDGDSVGTGDDIIIGGGGNDAMYGYAGNDTYIINYAAGISEGIDTIYDYDPVNGGNDAILINGVDNVYMNIGGRYSRELYIYDVRDGVYSGNYIKVVNQFHSSYPEYGVETVNGIAVKNAGLPLIGLPNFSQTLKATNYNDTIDGGNLNDKMYGYAGDDTYTFKFGDGIDTIYDYDAVNGGNDSVELTGVDEQTYMNRSGYDLYIYHVKEGVYSGHYIKVVNQFHPSYPEYGIETVNGVAVKNVGLDIKGLAGYSTTLTGTDFNDTLDGGDLNDTLSGGLGDDTYVLGENYAAEYIVDSGGQDVIQMEGIAFTDIFFNVSGNNLNIGTTQGTSAVIANQYNGAVTGQIEALEAGGQSFGLTGGLTVSRNGGDGSIYGTQFDDVVDGSQGGSNNLYGGAGVDEYVWGLGGGWDNIHDSGTNTLTLLGAEAEFNINTSGVDATITVLGSIENLDIFNYSSNDWTIAYTG